MSESRTTGTFPVKRGLAEMLKGGVIMDVVTPEQAKIAEDAGAVSVMALERVPADIRKQVRYYFLSRRTFRWLAAGATVLGLILLSGLVVVLEALLLRGFLDLGRELVKAGDVVKVKVMEVDTQRKRIGLSMRLTDEPGQAAPAKRGCPSRASPGPVRRNGSGLTRSFSRV